MKRILSLFISVVFISQAFAAEGLPVLKVTFPAANLVYEYYIQGEMTLEDTDGTIITLPAQLKTRGATALSYPMKPSFNMKLENEEGEEFDTNLLDLRKASSFILDAMAIDRICMRNRVCFDLWNEFSRLPYETEFDSRNGTVGKFVIVYMNDVYKGIYCLTDKINRKLLDLKKPKVEDNGDVTIRGVLYKNGTTEIADQNTPGFFNDYSVYVAQWHDAWELKEPEEYPGIPAWQPLINYYDAGPTNQYVINNFYTYNLIDYSLLIMALGIEDNWGYKNKYFSMKNFIGDPEERKFIVTPWDLDTSLGGHYNGDYFNGNYSHWSMQQIANSALYPFLTCFTVPDLVEEMKQKWAQLRLTTLSVENVAGKLYGYCDLFEETGAWQEYVDYWNTKKERPRYVDDLRAEIDLIVEWYADRFQQMDAYFGIDEGAGVESITGEHGQGKIYNLQGFPVDAGKLIPGEIYIQNGKKFLHKK